jgi:hypothetical protein
MISSIAFLVLALPPQVEITAKGTKITQGQTIVTVLPDGSVLVKSPSVNLVIPATDAEPVNPPADDLADALSAIYGADQDQLKKAKLAVLIKSYESALLSLDQAKTLSDLAQSMTKAQSLKADDLRPLRDRIAKEIESTLGTDAEAPLDVAAAKTFLKKLINTLKGI